MSREDVLRELKQLEEIKEAYNSAIDDAIEVVRKESNVRGNPIMNEIIAELKKLKK